jgi:hypothetical protein
MDDGVMAEGTALLHAGGEALPVRVHIGRPTERSWADWTVRVTITVGEEYWEHEPGGADSLQALCNGLLDAAVEVDRLRRRGRVSYEGRPDDYFCLDELLRRPATNGYLPTGIDRDDDRESGGPHG